MSISTILHTLRVRAHRPFLSRSTKNIALATYGALASNMAFAQVGGLTGTTTFLNQIKSWLYLVVPILAVIGGLVIFVLYMNNVLHKETAVRWFIGLLLASMVGEIVALAIRP